MLATPLRATDVALGEIGWALLRGAIYAAAFLVTMALLGLVSSPWAVLCLPAAMLIGFAFAGAGMAATTFMRSFVDFDYVNIALIPLFLFSATFFPLSRYPTGLQWLIRVTPLYQGVVLERSLVFGDLTGAPPPRRVPGGDGPGRRPRRRPPPGPPAPALTGRLITDLLAPVLLRGLRRSVTPASTHGRSRSRSSSISSGPCSSWACCGGGAARSGHSP